MTSVFQQPAYQQLRQIYAEATRRPVFWIGAGLSRPAGLPLWSELREHLEHAADRKLVTFGDADRDRYQRELSNIKQETDFWVAFERLKRFLKKTSFKEEIRTALQPAESNPPPALYERIWDLNPQGVLTLNLDRYPSRAYAEKQSKILNEFSGIDIGKYLHLFGHKNPFVANLHGILENNATWVLTKSEINDRLNDKAYRQSIQNILMTHMVIFVGITTAQASPRIRALRRRSGTFAAGG